jgi:transcriptional regulator with XRE-family HTH domain
MKRLKQLRAEKGLSQARLAARAELDPSTVNQIERGAREASPATLRKLADALDVSLADLLEESPKVSAPPSPEPSLNNELDEERRSTAFIKVLRAYFWDLRLRWKEQGDKPSPGQIRDALDLLQRLTDHGALEGSFTPREHSELQLLLNAADKLRPIAEELAAEGGTTPSRQMVDEVFGELDKQLEKVNR